MQDMLICGGQVYAGGRLQAADVLVQSGRIAALGPGLRAPAGTAVVPAAGCVLAPGFVDLHTHLREPGFEAKETIATGTRAAAAGGFTTVCAMPNLSPVPDDLHALSVQLAAIEAGAVVRVLPYGALTAGQLGACPADMAALAAAVAGFSDDGRGVQDEAMMRRVMQQAAGLGSLVAAHCEVEALLPEAGVCVHAGCGFARRHGFAGHTSQSEYAEVERNIRLCGETGCRLHICHISAAESVAMVREAKRRGLPVTCEATPHNLLLSCDDITGDDGRFKMNPPLRTGADRQALAAALREGVIDAVATDHAPHTEAEKAGGFAKALNGVVGLETAFAALYTGLVLPGVLGLETLLERMTHGPRRVLGLPAAGLAPGDVADCVLLDLARAHRADPQRFESRGRATPFAGRELHGWPVLTLCAGRVAWRAG